MSSSIVLFILLACLRVSYSIIYTTTLKTIKSTTFEIIDDSIVEKGCASDLKTVVAHAAEYKLWALRMLDATGKVYRGVLEGNSHLFGDFDQCLSIFENIDNRTIKGQYCTVSLKTKDENTVPNFKRIKFGGVLKVLSNASITLGICIPQACSTGDAEQILNALEKKFDLPTQANIIEDSCFHRDRLVETNGLDVFIYSLFIIYFILIMCVTSFDVYYHYSDLDPKYFVIFSAYSNLKRLLSQRPNNHNTITCLNGIKVITTFWILFAQMTFLVTFVSKNPIFFMTEWNYQSSNTLIWTALFGIDTYFTISGLLLSYIYLKHSEKFSVQLKSFYLIRVLRLKPALLATILIHISILKLLADGPYGHFLINTYSRNCSKSWWTIFFYFTNFWNYRECAPHTWHISVDTQLYLASPLILFFMKKYPKRVVSVGIFAFIFGVIYPVLITIYKQVGYTIFEWDDDFQDYIFFSVLTRLPSWLIGVFFGYCLHYKKFKFSKTMNIVLWTIAITAMLKLIVNQMVFVENEYSVYRSALWNGFSRPIWSLALCFIIYSCATGRGGILNRFLSHPVFRVLSKLTYCMNLTSFGVLLIYIFNTKETFYFGNFELISMFLFVVVIVVIFSTLLYLGYEAPLISLKDHMERGQDKKSSAKMT